MVLSNSLHLQPQRGAAIVELSLLLPIAVLFLLAGEWALELLLVKVKLREVVRFAAWETASYPQTDVATGAFTRRTRVVGEAAADRARARYADLDSAADRLKPSGLIAHASAPDVEITHLPLTWREPGGGTVRPDGGGRAATLAASMRTAVLELPARWGLGPPSMVRAESRIQLAAPRWPGGATTHRTFQAHLAVVTDSWFLPDGTDSTVAGDRTGVHPDGHRSGLWLQVRRMRLLGQRGLLEPEKRAAALLTSFFPFGAPEVDGTFVVDHALGREVRGTCEGAPGYPREALGGLRDFGEAVGPGAPRCFGTQPLRDTQEYEASTQLHALRARGPWFMGCPNAEADDPSRTHDEDVTDANVLKQSCGVGR